MILAHRFVTAALVVAAVVVSGCGKKISAVCEAKCGKDAQLCIDTNEKNEGTAEERGCEGEFEAYAACADAKATCKDGVLDTAGCASELAALNTCQQ